MKLLISLIKKDFLLVKKNNLALLLFSIVMPILLSLKTPRFQTDGFILYGTLTLMLTFMNYNMLSVEEMKQEGMVYIQTTPISNNMIGLSKFITVSIPFSIISLIYFILSKIDITKVGPVGVKGGILIFFLIQLFFSVYIPLTFKLGYAKLQIVGAGIVILSPFLVGFLTKILKSGESIFFTLGDMPDILFFAIAILVIIIMISLSIKVTSSILDHKEY